MSLRAIFNLFLLDIFYSLSYGKYKLFGFLFFIAFLAIMLSLQLKSAGSNSIGTFFVMLKDYGYITKISDYQVPYYWVFIQFVVLFLIGDYLSRDMENNQIYLVLRGRSKLNYILSKMLWIVFQNILIFLFLFIIVYVISSVMLGDFSIGSSPFYQKSMVALMAIKVTPEQFLFRLFIGFIMTSIVLSSLQLFAMQLTSPILTYFGVILISCISTFSGSKWLPAIHSMIMKSSIFNQDHHLTLEFSAEYCAVVYVLVTGLTIYFYKKKDIL